MEENEMEKIQKLSNESVTNEQEIKKEFGLHMIKQTFEEDIQEGKTKFYYGSIRSGQKIEYDGSIVIIGDVNSGAEVFATGNIAILGSLRGIAHAGATGNTKATISAMDINAPQIRIANIVQEMESDRELKRETAHAMENQIIIED